MLNKESRKLLSWITKQSVPPSKWEMEQRDIPYYSSDRLEWLKKEGYLSFTIEPRDGEMAACYAITDKGRSALQEVALLSRKEMWNWIRYIITTIIAFIALIRTF